MGGGPSLFYLPAVFFFILFYFFASDDALESPKCRSVDSEQVSGRFAILFYVFFLFVCLFVCLFVLGFLCLILPWTTLPEDAEDRPLGNRVVCCGR